jgi:hypothetical protein
VCDVYVLRLCSQERLLKFTFFYLEDGDRVSRWLS